MAYNRNWVKTDGTRLEFALTWLNTDAGRVINPSDEQYRAAGWMANEVQPPSPPEGMMTSGTRYEVVCEGGLYSVVAVYDYAQAPKVPRVFSKLYLVMALKRRGLFEQFMVVVRAAQLEAEWGAAQDIAEDFTGFADYEAQIGAALGLTDSQVEEILAEAVAR